MNFRFTKAYRYEFHHGHMELDSTFVVTIIPTVKDNSDSKLNSQLQTLNLMPIKGFTLYSEKRHSCEAK